MANGFGIKNRIVASAIVSSIKGKKLTVYDAEGTAVGKFYENGNYAETWSGGGSSESCSGRWKDLGNNKIATTCEDNGTTLEPDGNIVNEDETHLQFKSDTLTVGDSVTIIDNETFDVKVRSIENIDTSTPIPSNLVWESWPEQNPMMDGQPITTLDKLIASFTNISYANWFIAMNNNGNDIEATLSSNGNVVNVSGYEPNGGALHGSTVLGTWTKSNNMINISMNTGEKIYIRLGTSGVNYVVQVAYE